MARIKAHPSRVSTTDSRRLRPLKPPIDPHYNTPEHAAWSHAVIVRAGYACQGREHPQAKPREGVRLFADHIVELQDDRSRALDLSNGQALCGACHTAKTAAERAKRLRA